MEESETECYSDLNSTYPLYINNLNLYLSSFSAIFAVKSFRKTSLFRYFCRFSG